MAAPWLRTLDTQVEMIKWWRSSGGVDFGDGFVDDVKNRSHGGLVGDWNGKDLAGMEARGLDSAETIWTKGDLVDYVQYAAESMPPEPLKDVDLPFPAGFVMLETPVLLPEIKSIGEHTSSLETAEVKAVLWRPTVITLGEWPHGERQLGIALSFYASREYLMRGLHGELRNRMPPLVLLTTTGWPFDMDWTAQETNSAMDMAWEARSEEECEGLLNQLLRGRRFMKAYWHLIQQPKYTDVSEQGNPREERRRAARAGFLGEIDKIRVITLRKKKARIEEHPEENGDGGGREFSHRFVRQGHWRNQWYPSVSMHRQIWIDETIVGPDWLPLVIKDRVFRWTR